MSLNYLIPFVLYVATVHPSAFKATRGVFGSWIASSEGFATTAGVLFHALVFVIVVGFLMRTLNPHTAKYGSYVPWGDYTQYGPGYGIDGLYKLAVPPCMDPEGCVV
jgi:hypothetical protein